MKTLTLRPLRPLAFAALAGLLLTTSAERPPAAEAQEAAEAATPTPAPAGPIAPSTAADIQQALLEASDNEAGLRRLIDPEWGVGSYDPSHSGVHQHCDPASFTSHAGMSFVVRHDDTFRCERDLRRCSSEDPNGGGYVFYFRDGPGESVYLNAVVHYEGRVPRSDSAAVRNFVRDGDGICALYRALTSREREASPPSQLSVFVASHTGLVERSLSEHPCGEAAAAAYAERIAPVASAGAPTSCERGPARCVYSTRDMVTTVYGEEGRPNAVAVTRPGMYPNLERQQSNEVTRFLASIRGRRCGS